MLVLSDHTALCKASHTPQTPPSTTAAMHFVLNSPSPGHTWFITISWGVILVRFVLCTTAAVKSGLVDQLATAPAAVDQPGCCYCSYCPAWLSNPKVVDQTVSKDLELCDRSKQQAMGASSLRGCSRARDLVCKGNAPLAVSAMVYQLLRLAINAIQLYQVCVGACSARLVTRGVQAKSRLAELGPMQRRMAHTNTLGSCNYL